MLVKWLTFGIGVKRWILSLFIGNILGALGFAILILLPFDKISVPVVLQILAALGSILGGLVVTGTAFYKLSDNLLSPYRNLRNGRVVDVVVAHHRGQRGMKVVAIGGGTGLPSVLRGLKSHTDNITAVVTVADDGGSSGRLRRELGIPPPGDLRNNIAALADDEHLMTHLFQYRFQNGELNGHAFGNLFIAALAGVTGSLETALTEVSSVLNIQGTVLPATLEDVNLSAKMRLPNKLRTMRVQGESKIGSLNGHIEEVALHPPNPQAFAGSIQAILDADLIVFGPGSLYTSILPNLLVPGIRTAVQQSPALKIYICNVATQPGETTDYTVADHVEAIEKHVGRGLFRFVLANNATPQANAGPNTYYVEPAPEGHAIAQRYHLYYTDLTDTDRPWRHDPHKLANALLEIVDLYKMDSRIPAAPVQKTM